MRSRAIGRVERRKVWFLFALMPLNGAVFALDGSRSARATGRISPNMVKLRSARPHRLPRGDRLRLGIVGVWAALVVLIVVRPADDSRHHAVAIAGHDPDAATSEIGGR